jgi:hypothetical protein
MFCIGLVVVEAAVGEWSAPARLSKKRQRPRPVRCGEGRGLARYPATTTHRVNLQANPFPLVNHATAQGREILSHACLPSIIGSIGSLKRERAIGR